ncbi:hypothetical protein CYY_000125 [Polysphondylium violaceum]|uniref:Uncharacterized protein n=1 Tax=Polysphondylium violaceum TaxID=133409 RepID=A0A8J4Q4G6_9MYCE|nr:hypothetical protein CYY_000125 [Polysphondylium violaceum]
MKLIIALCILLLSIQSCYGAGVLNRMSSLHIKARISWYSEDKDSSGFSGDLFSIPPGSQEAFRRDLTDEGYAVYVEINPTPNRVGIQDRYTNTYLVPKEANIFFYDDHIIIDGAGRRHIIPWKYEKGKNHEHYMRNSDPICEGYAGSSEY